MEQEEVAVVAVAERGGAGNDLPQVSFSMIFHLIPLVIIMFRKYDGGIRVCSKKTVLNRNVFLTTPIKTPSPDKACGSWACRMRFQENGWQDRYDGRSSRT